MAAIEEPDIPVGIALAMGEPAAEKSVATRERVGGGAAISLAIDVAISGVTRSSASRHSTQSFAASPTAKFFCAPNPGQARSITRAPRRRAISTVSSRLPESTTSTSLANVADARQSTIASAASRVMTQRLKGSDPDMRVAFMEASVPRFCELRAFYGVSLLIALCARPR